MDDVLVLSEDLPWDFMVDLPDFKAGEEAEDKEGGVDAIVGGEEPFVDVEGV